MHGMLLMYWLHIPLKESEAIKVGQKITYLLRHRDQDIKNYETFLKFLKP